VDDSLGKVTIAPNVLVTIAQRTATAVPGVDRLADSVPGVKRFFGIRSVGQGIEVRVVDGRVLVDVYLVARRSVDLLQVGRQIQHDLTRAIRDIVGREVGEVNVHIEDVATELPALAQKRSPLHPEGR
jgi:uncharacterized alkaline shock family protein YloU